MISNLWRKILSKTLCKFPGHNFKQVRVTSSPGLKFIVTQCRCGEREFIPVEKNV